MPEGKTKDPYEEMTETSVGISVCREYIGVARRLQFGKAGPRPPKTEVIRRETKTEIIAKNEVLHFEESSEEHIISVNNNINCLRTISLILSF